MFGKDKNTKKEKREVISNILADASLPGPHGGTAGIAI